MSVPVPTLRDWLAHPLTSLLRWRVHRAAQLMRRAETEKHRAAHEQARPRHYADDDE